MTGESTSNAARAVVLGPGAGRKIPNPSGAATTFKAVGAEPGGRLLAFETTVAPGEGPPLHYHHDMDEVLYVLEGEMRFQLGAELHPAPAGTFMFIPPGTVHAWQNVGNTPARFLAITNPAGFERFFERMAESGTQAGDRDAFVAIGREAGMEVVGPPLSQAT
jgi:quercetin dioxygenase-like cupin family protein